MNFWKPSSMWQGGAGFITEQELQDSPAMCANSLMTDEAQYHPPGELVRAEGSQPGENASSLD